jgi:pimeloyl-ACP methyl ester carboxylesterase
MESPSTHAGSPIVFLHGLGVDASCWGEVIEALPDFECIAIDLPGHGKAPLVGPVPTVADFAAHVMSEVTRLGLSRMILVGTSLGGLVAQHIAATTPDRVDRLVLVDTVATYPEVVRQQWRDRAATARSVGMESIVAPTLDTWFTAEGREAQLPVVAKVADKVRGMNPEGYAQACEVLEFADTCALLTSITAPTLIVCGTNDLPPFLAAVPEFEAAIPQTDVVWLAGKHGVSLEASSVFASTLREALQA